MSASDTRGFLTLAEDKLLEIDTDRISFAGQDCVVESMHRFR